MKKLLRKLIILIIVVCIFLLIQKNTTRFGTSTQTGNVETGAIATGIDLTNCVSYFDGCNTCSVKDGKADACTLMYCETPTEPKCLQYATGTEVTGTEEQQNIEPSNVYTVQTEETSNGSSQNIYIYDESGKKVFTLLGNFGGVRSVIGDYAVINGGGDSMQLLAIYNITTNEKLFELSYPNKQLLPKDQAWKSEYDLRIEGSKIHILNLVHIPNDQGKTYMPQNASACPTEWTSKYGDNFGYSQIWDLDLGGKTISIKKSDIRVCTFLQ